MSTFRSEPLYGRMAAIAVGMFVGAWVIGPLVTRTPEAPAAAAPDQTQSQQAAPQQPLGYEAMLSRPDPLPYRAPTPNFGSYNAPNYAAIAKEKALAGVSDDEPMAEELRPTRASRSYRSFDRHRAY